MPKTGDTLERLRSECAASITEYAIGLALLVGIFVVAGILLRSAATTRGNLSMEVGNASVACASGPLAAYGAGSADACK